MELKNLQDLYLDVLKDLYDVENKLLRALPKMAKKASSEELRAAFEEHLEQTQGHVQRLEEAFEELGETAKRKTCKGINGLLEEGAELMEEAEEPEVRDAGLIAAAQKVEHYEIASYGTARAYAELMGRDEAVRLLEETLDEEKTTDQKLSELAAQINLAAEEPEEEEEEEMVGATTGRRTAGAPKHTRSVQSKKK